MNVYRIRCSKTAKVYIGVTKRSLGFRWKKHMDALVAGKRQAIYAAMRKYGVENFSMELIASVDSAEEMFRMEREWISKEDSRRNGYNMTDGGDGPAGMQYTQEQREAMRRRQLGKIPGPETRAKMSASRRGKKFPPRPAEWCAKISAGNRGKKCAPCSDAQRALISAANAGSGNGMFGRGHTHDAKAKIAEANRIGGLIYLNAMRGPLADAAAAGAVLQKDIAIYLNSHSHLTRFGCKWDARSVSYLLSRYAQADMPLLKAA